MSQEDNQVVEATISDESQNIEQNFEDTSNESESIESLKAQIAEKDNFARQAVARSKKAEAELKALRESGQINNNPVSIEDIEAKILLSKGLDAELIDEMKTLSKIRGKSLIEVENDPIIIAIKGEREAKIKAERSKLGASKGSGQVKQGKTLSSSGLSTEEHKALWKEAMGR